MSKGNPRAAVEAWLIATGQSERVTQMQREGLKHKMFKGKAPEMVQDAPRGTSVSVEADIAPDIQLLAFPLAWFLAGELLPSDFASVERSGKGLKEHIRPDGSVFLGLYEMPDERETGIVVFGPPDTPKGHAVQVSQQYRAEIHALESGRLAAQANVPALVS